MTESFHKKFIYFGFDCYEVLFQKKKKLAQFFVFFDLSEVFERTWNGSGQAQIALNWGGDH